MGIEKSAGAIVFYPGDPGHNEQIQYLLLRSDFWGFPKGHIERGEKEQDAARREIREEAGLDVTLIEEFRQVDEYWYQRKGERIKKQAIFFLAQARDREAKISWEHQEVAWLPFDQAMERLKFKNLREILTRADEFLKAKSEK